MIASSQSTYVQPGQGYDGVVLVKLGNRYSTGILLYDGLAVLTAAHLVVEPANAPASAITVSFDVSQGRQTVTARDYLIHPGYEASSANNDLALIWLSQPAPNSADRYGLYREGNELGQTLTMVGYGLTGTGIGGAVYDGAAPNRHLAYNTIDADIGELKTLMGGSMGWRPLGGTQLVADFDNGLAGNDALGLLMGRQQLGLGAREGILAPGDSGGPAFIDGLLAGVASYTASLSQGNIFPDVDGLSNSSFGEIAAWQRVSYYQQWIDRSLRSHYPDAPSTPEEVTQQVVEGNSGTRYAYFLLSFTGVRDQASDILSVDYATRDGTAKAGEDYLATRGTLVLYPGEAQAVIAVEVIGDSLREGNETFYLDVTNPVGGSFGEAVSHLTAMRTILDDDAGVQLLGLSPVASLV